MKMEHIKTRGIFQGLTKDEQYKAFNYRKRSNHIIDGIRVAISSGFDKSIFDLIVSEDGKVTLDEIRSFLSSLADDCAPKYKVVEGSERLQEYLYGLLTDYVFSRIYSYLFHHADKHESIIAIEDEYVQFDLSSKEIRELRESLSFVKLVTDVRDYPLHEAQDLNSQKRLASYAKALKISIPHEYLDIHCPPHLKVTGDLSFDEYIKALEQVIGRQAPYKEHYLKCCEVFRWKTLPSYPYLIRESVLCGIEIYCSNYGLSLIYRGNKGKKVLNTDYKKVINILLGDLDRILNYRDEMEGN